MENWKELLASFGLWLLVEDISDDGDGKGDNLQLTKDGELFVSEIRQELDKAREETRQEERDMFIVRYATVSFNEVIKTIKTLSIIEFLSIKWGLKGKKKSKLTTK